MEKVIEIECPECKRQESTFTWIGIASQASFHGVTFIDHLYVCKCGCKYVIQEEK